MSVTGIVQEQDADNCHITRQIMMSNVINRKLNFLGNVLYEKTQDLGVYCLASTMN